jgi:hypothetical protein
MGLKEMARQILERNREENTPASDRDDHKISIPLSLDQPEDTEMTQGKPCFVYQGNILAWEKDPPHIKLYAWATVNLHPGRPLAVDIDRTARLLGVTSRDVREALVRLVKDGDLVRSLENGRELYRLNVRY